MSPAPARVLSNLALPSPDGIALRAFHDYLPPGTDPSAPHPEFARRALRDILPLISAAERPEALIIASPEYLPIPSDLAGFPGMKILLITDWNVCLRFLPDLCPLFDFCFTDWPGYRMLRRAGIGNVFHQPLFGHDPAVFRPFGLRRNLDVSFCGNLNAGLHGERNRLLARVARWAGDRPLHLRQAFDGAYVDVLNRSRLVFNFSIRGEANMRLFEAMACGSAPLVEASNQEVPILFQEGKHYFRYHPDRLEARLDELLSDPARLAAVGDAARIAVARHSKADQIRSLLEFAAREAPGLKAGATGPVPRDDQGNSGDTVPDAIPYHSAKALAKIRLLGSTYTLPEAVAEIQALTPALPGLDAETLPATLLTLLEGSSEPMPAAEAVIERLLSDGRQPAPIAAFLRMRLEARRGHWEAVLSLAEVCGKILDSLSAPASESPADRIDRLRGLYSRYYPPIHLGKGFNTDINRAYQQDLGTSPDPAGPLRAGDEGHSAFARLLQAQCVETQAQALCALGRAAEAMACLDSIPERVFISVDVRANRAQAAEAAGDSARAKREWEAAFAERPLDTRVWDKLAEALVRSGDRPALIAFLEDILVLARAFLPEDQALRVRERLDQERRV
ncbi:MAG: glycosyltransferase [Fibrobacteres bacterium]|nr:glycosyltransferase [Fibrobacterota bacterium]